MSLKKGETLSRIGPPASRGGAMEEKSALEVVTGTPCCSLSLVPAGRVSFYNDERRGARPQGGMYRIVVPGGGGEWSGPICFTLPSTRWRARTSILRRR